MTNVVLNSGTGGATLATYTDSGVVDHQKFVLETQTGVADPVTVSSSNPLPVTLANTGANATAVKVDGSAVTQPVSAAALPLPTGASTAAKQPALGTAGTASADVITVQGIAGMTALKVDGSAVTQPVSGTFWQATQPISGTVTANIGTSGSLALDASVTGLQVAQGSATAGQKGELQQGAVTTGAPTYVTGQTSPLSLTTAGGLRVDGSGVTQPVSGTFWQATQPVSGTVNAAQSGTWTVQPGNTANTTAWLVNDAPVTSGGLSFLYVLSAATNNLTQAKATAGQLYTVVVTNTNAAARYLKVFNKASASVTMGTTAADYQFVIPGNTAGAGVAINIDKGLAMGTGITIAITAGVALNDNTAVAANEVSALIGYK